MINFSHILSVAFPPHVSIDSVQNKFHKYLIAINHFEITSKSLNWINSVPSNQRRLPATGTLLMTACPRNDVSRPTLCSALAPAAASSAANGILAGVAGNAANMSRANTNKCRQNNADGMDIFVVVSCKNLPKKKKCEIIFLILSGSFSNKLIYRAMYLIMKSKAAIICL